MNPFPTCFVGVDPGRYGHGMVALAADGRVPLREKIDNSEEANVELLTRVVDLAGGAGRSSQGAAAGAQDDLIDAETVRRSGVRATPGCVAWRRCPRRSPSRAC